MVVSLFFSKRIHWFLGWFSLGVSFGADSECCGINRQYAIFANLGGILPPILRTPPEAPAILDTKFKTANSGGLRAEPRKNRIRNPPVCFFIPSRQVFPTERYVMV